MDDENFKQKENKKKYIRNSLYRAFINELNGMDFKSKFNILDMGCKSNNLLKIIRNNDVNYNKLIGVTHIRAVLNELEKNNTENEYFYKSIYDYTYEEQVSVIACFDSFENYLYKKLVFDEFYDLLEKDGYLFIKQRNAKSLFDKICIFLKDEINNKPHIISDVVMNDYIKNRFEVVKVLKIKEKWNEPTCNMYMLKKL